MSFKTPFTVIQAENICSRLGKAKDIRPLHVYNSVYTDGEDSPIAVFKFKYRSKSKLYFISEASQELTAIDIRGFTIHASNLEVPNSRPSGRAPCG